jgi:hypothetical protein
LKAPGICTYRRIFASKSTAIVAKESISPERPLSAVPGFR